MIKCNVGGPDRALRIVLGVGMIAFAVIAKNPWGWIGLVPLLTGLFKFCPAYSVCKLSTNKETPQ